jgi:hypothetical protein
VALSPAAEKAVRAEAERRGQDPEAAVEHARSLMPDDEGGKTGESGTARPTFERLLIGVLPFIKVRELRSIWLGLDERVPDDEMMCGDFQVKHGGAAAAPAPGVPE